MTALYYISLSIFAIFIIAIYLRFGILKSISASGPTLKDYGQEGFFTLWAWGIAFTILPYWIEFVPVKDFLSVFLPVLAAGSLGFVGATPLYQIEESLENKVHNAGSYTCAAAAYLWTFLYGNDNIGFVALGLSAIVLLIVTRKRIVYWIEMIAFVNLYIQIRPNWI